MSYFSDDCSNRCHPHYCGEVFTTCLFSSMDLQLLHICVQNWVVPSVVNTIHRVLSVTVHNLHAMFCEKDIQRTFLCWQQDSSPYRFHATPIIHHLHHMLREKMERSAISSSTGKRLIKQFLMHKWAVTIAMYIWSQVIQLCQSFYMCILVKRCQHVTFSHMSQKCLINNSTCDDRNTKHTITRYLTNGWVTMLSFHTDMSKILWQVMNSR